MIKKKNYLTYKSPKSYSAATQISFYNSKSTIVVQLSPGVLAMESLHRQVLPFILRRLKEDVLQDLPPKIMQDYYCELSPIQVCIVINILFTKKL